MWLYYIISTGINCTTYLITLRVIISVGVCFIGGIVIPHNLGYFMHILTHKVREIIVGIIIAT